MGPSASLTSTADGTDSIGDRREASVAFTPGPWRISDAFPATVYAGSYEGSDIRIVSDRANFNDEDAANASLISAAPALFEAIKPLAFSSQWDPPVGVEKADWEAAVLAAREALRLARGEKK